MIHGFRCSNELVVGAEAVRSGVRRFGASGVYLRAGCCLQSLAAVRLPGCRREEIHVKALVSGSSTLEERDGPVFTFILEAVCSLSSGFREDFIRRAAEGSAPSRESREILQLIIKLNTSILPKSCQLESQSDKTLCSESCGRRSRVFPAMDDL